MMPAWQGAVVAAAMLCEMACASGDERAAAFWSHLAFDAVRYGC